jgi:hypothetical protein
MESLFDCIWRATVQQEALGTVLLVGTKNPSDQHSAGDGMLWKMTRIAKFHETALA